MVSIKKLKEKAFLDVEFLSRKLKNPIIIAASPLTERVEMIEKLISCDVGAIVIKTIQLDCQKTHEKGFIKKYNNGLINSTTYSEDDLSAWISKLKLIKNADRIIASIYSTSSKRIIHAINCLSEVGIQDVELSISCPSDSDCQVFNPLKIYGIMKEITLNCKANIIIKISAIDDFVNKAKAAIDGGASAICISDSIPVVKVDLNSKSLEGSCIIGYSGSPIKPIVQRAIYELIKHKVKVPIIGVGGISCLEDVLEYLHLGCCAVQICSWPLVEGYKVINELIIQLNDWCLKNNTRITDIIGTIKD